LPIFNQVFVLQTSLETLKHRLQIRTSNDFGKDPIELAHILEHFDPSGDYWRELGATVINADQPIKQVADDILAHINVKEGAL
jgi:hypothetical protein